MDKTTRRKINTEITRCLRIARKTYSRKFNRPKVSLFSNNFKKAGECFYDSWRIELNEDMLELYPDEIIYQVLPHEIAHLIDMKVNIRRLFKMKRRAFHGKSWRDIMRLFDVVPLTYFVY